MTTTLVRIVARRKTAAAWTSSAEVLLAGEFGVETDTLKVKVGDGVTAWGSLAYHGTSAAPTGTAGGDLSGSYPNPTVAKVNGVTVTGTPATGNLLTATSTTAASWSAPAGDTSRLRYQSGWTASTAYAVNDVVTYNGSAYVCLTAHTSGTSFSGPGTNWGLLVRGLTASTTAPSNPLTHDVWVDET